MGVPRDPARRVWVGFRRWSVCRSVGQQPAHRFGPLGVAQREPVEHRDRFGEVLADGLGIGSITRVVPGFGSLGGRGFGG